MIAIYYKSNDSQWKYELEQTEFEYIIKNLMEDTEDIDDMFDESLEILRDVSGLEDDELDEEEQIDQTIAVAFLWQYFNHLAPEDERIAGDIALIEEEDGTGVTVVPASSILEDE
jgi:hypothetical protein